MTLECLDTPVVQRLLHATQVYDLQAAHWAALRRRGWDEALAAYVQVGKGAMGKPGCGCISGVCWGCVLCWLLG
jgi:hypothetical protein